MRPASVIDLKTCFLLKLLLGEWFAFIIFAVFEFKFHQKEIVSRVGSLDVSSTSNKIIQKKRSIRNVIAHTLEPLNKVLFNLIRFSTICAARCVVEASARRC